MLSRLPPKSNGDFLIQRYTSGKMFLKIQSVALTWSC